MLNVSKTVRQDQTVIILRPTLHHELYCPYSAILQKQGVHVVEHLGANSPYLRINAGCRAGLLMLTQEEDIAHLALCETLLNRVDIAWVGMIAPELLSDIRVRECISTYLFNFLMLPAHREHIMLMLRHAWGMAFVRDSHHTQLPIGADMSSDAASLMVGNSKAMQHLFSQINKVAATDATVLLTGASGTGKELAALALHRQSSRSQAPFVAVNCGAISPQLLQSELFGHEKGAFTGAQQRKVGHIEAASGGTLLLDEIGDMPLDMQINLLRFLQEKRIVRVGGHVAVDVDVRIIAATHVDLAAAVALGSFREDLYYRINVICINTPKLSERDTDIDNLAQHFFTKFNNQHQRRLRGFSRTAMRALRNHPWPGNVRELINRVQRAVVMAEGVYIQSQDLGLAPPPCRDKLLSLEAARASTDRVMIHSALDQARHQVSHAADLLGVSRVTLYRLLEKYNIQSRPIASSSTTILDNAQ